MKLWLLENLLMKHYGENPENDPLIRLDRPDGSPIKAIQIKPGKEPPDFNQERNCPFCYDTGFGYISLLSPYSYCLTYSCNSYGTINARPKTAYF